jgi:thiol:disulfide interchange protein
VRYAAIAIVLACSTRAPDLRWVTDEAQAFERARGQSKGVMIEFCASWAIPCGEVELRLNASAATIEKHFVPLKIDVSQDSPALDEIRARYDAKTLPTVVFVTTTGQELARLQTVPDERELSSVLDKASAGL